MADAGALLDERMTDWLEEVQACSQLLNRVLSREPEDDLAFRIQTARDMLYALADELEAELVRSELCMACGERFTPVAFAAHTECQTKLQT